MHSTAKNSLMPIDLRNKVCVIIVSEWIDFCPAIGGEIAQGCNYVIGIDRYETSGCPYFHSN